MGDEFLNKRLNYIAGNVDENTRQIANHKAEISVHDVKIKSLEKSVEQMSASTANRLDKFDQTLSGVNTSLLQLSDKVDKRNMEELKRQLDEKDEQLKNRRSDFKSWFQWTAVRVIALISSLVGVILYLLINGSPLSN